MFKRLASYLTLICFLNNSCVEPVIASLTMHKLHVNEPPKPRLHIILNKNDAGEFVVDGNNLFITDFEQVDLMFGQTAVGELSNKQGALDFRGFGSHNFYLTNLPSTKSLTVNSGGSLFVDSQLRCSDFINMCVYGKTSLTKGFMVKGANGFASFSGGAYDLYETSIVKELRLGNLRKFTISKCSSLNSTLLNSEGLVNSLRIFGELHTQLAKLDLDRLESDGYVGMASGRIKANDVSNRREFKSEQLELTAKKLYNSGHMKLGKAGLDVTTTTNAGTIDAAEFMDAKGAWQNNKSGILKVGGHFQGIFTSYKDDGHTEVGGFAMITTAGGRLSGTFQTRNAIVQSTGDFSVADTAALSIQDHFTLSSVRNLGFFGTLTLKYRKDWPMINMSSELRRMIRNLKPGAYISARGDLKKGANVKSNNSSIHFSAGGHYNAVGGASQSGFFEGHHTYIAAAKASLADEIRSYNNLALQAKFAELKGARNIDNVFSIDVEEDLIQSKDDHTKACIIEGRVRNARLAGNLDLDQLLILKVTYMFKTLESNLIKGGFTSVNANRANLSGTTIAGEGQRIVVNEALELGETYNASTKASYLDGDTITHHGGSQLKVEGTSVENAHKFISLEQRSSTKAQNNVLKADDHITIAGQLESDELAKLDTNHFEKTASSLIKGGVLACEVVTAKLNGKAENSHLQLEAEKTVTFGKDDAGGWNSAWTKAEDIIHEAGSNHSAITENRELARNSLQIQPKSKVEADQNYIDADNRAEVAGEVTSQKLTHIHTKEFLLTTKGQLISGSAVDEENVGFLGSIFRAILQEVKAFIGIEKEGLVSIKVDNATLSGLINSARLQAISSGGIKFKETYRGQLDSSYSCAEGMIEHEEGSIHNVRATNVEKGKKGIQVQNGGMVCATSNYFESDSNRKVSIAGDVTSKKLTSMQAGIFDLEFTGKLSTGIFFGQVQDGMLAGMLEITKPSIMNCKGLFETTYSSFIKGGTLIVKTKSARLDGKAKDSDLQLIALEDVNYGKNYKGGWNSASTAGKKIIHEPGSDNRIKKDNIEIAQEVIAYQAGSKGSAANNRLISEGQASISGSIQSRHQTHIKGDSAEIKKTGEVESGDLTYVEGNSSFRNSGQMESKNHFFKFGSSIYNTGDIRSAENYSADTKDHLNCFGTMSAKHADISAERSNLSLGGTLDVKTKNIKTGFNLSLFSSDNGSGSIVSRWLDFRFFNKRETLWYHAVDTGFSMSFMSDERADVSVVNADYFNFALASNQSARHMQVNTLLNLNALNHMSGRESLTINALLANIALPGSIYTSNAYTSNSFFDIFDMSMRLPHIPTFDFCDSPEATARLLMSAGRSLFTGVVGNVISTVQWGVNAQSIWESGEKLLADDTTENDSNYWRLSRIASRSGKMVGFVKSVADLGFDIKNLYDASFQGQTTPPPSTSSYRKLIDLGLNAIGGSTNINSLFQWDDGENVGNNINRLGLFVYNNSLTLAAQHNIRTVEGADNSTTFAITNTTKALGDFSVGGQKSSVDYAVSAGGTVILREGLAANGSGVFSAIAGDFVIKEKNADVVSGAVVYYGSKGTTVDGLSQATSGSVNATSDGTVLEKADARTMAAKTVNFFGKKVITEKGAESYGEIVNHNAQTTDFAGKVMATERSSLTSTPEGELYLRRSAQDTSPLQVVGSFQPHEDGGAAPTIDDAGPVFIEPGANLAGESLLLRGRGIPDVPDLRAQTGLYSNFNFTKEIGVETNQHVRFDEATPSSVPIFKLWTDQITVGKNTTLSQPEQLWLSSMKEDLKLEAGATIGSGVYSRLYSAKDIVGEHNKHLTNITEGAPYDVGQVNKVLFEHVTFASGTGLEYEYIDPATGEKSIRKRGFDIITDGQMRGVGMKFSGQSDIVVNTKKGFYNDADADNFLHPLTSGYNQVGYTIPSGEHHYKRNYGAAVLSPEYLNQGKVIVVCEEGGAHTMAATFANLGGLEFITRDDVELGQIVVSEGKVKFKKSELKKQKTEKIERRIRKLPKHTIGSNINNPKDEPVRLWSLDGDIKLPGFTYIGSGLLSLRGRHLYLDRPIYDTHQSSSGIRGSIDFSFFNQWKSLQAIQSTADILSNINHGSWGNALLSGFDPSMQASLDWIKNEGMHQTLGQGGILAGNLETIFSEGIHQNNGYGITVLGDAFVVTPFWEENGAKLIYSNSEKRIGLFANASANNASIGIHSGYNETKGHAWVPAETNIGGTLYANIGRLDQDAGVINAHRAVGRVEEFASRTRQDKRKTKGWNLSLGFSMSLDANISANYWEKKSRLEKHTSGLNLSEANDGFSIGKATLKGATLKGTRAESVIHRSLPQEYANRGFSLGLSGNPTSPGNAVVQAGVSEKNHEIDVSLMSRTPYNQDPSKLWKSAGGISYSHREKVININNVPIVTGVNREAWSEARKNVNELGGKILKGTEKALSSFKEDAHNPAELGSKDGILAVEPDDKVVAPVTPSSESCIDNLESTQMNKLRSMLISESVIDPENAQELVSPLINENTTEAERHGHLILELAEKSTTTAHPILEASHLVESESHALGNILPEIKEATHGQHQGSLGWATKNASPYGVLETLYEPLIFENYAFNYRVAGTNYYLENPSQLHSIMDVSRSLATHPSTYVQKSYAALNDPELAVFFFDAAKIPSGDLGRIYASAKLKGAQINGPVSTQLLNGDCVAVATGVSDPHSPPAAVMAHEGMHEYQALQSGGFFTPGHVSGNQQLTTQNRIHLLESYSADARALGYRDFSIMPRAIYNAGQIEGVLMYSGPWQYFENAFRRNLMMEGVYFSEPQIRTILTDVQRNLINGKPPSARFFAKPSYVTDGVGRSLIAAEIDMAAELPALLTEAERITPGIASKWANTTHEFLEALDDKTTFSFAKEPHPLVSNPSAPHLKQPWHHNPLVKNGVIIPALDLALHIYGERYQGFDWPKSLSRGTVRTVIDAAIYTPLFHGVAHFLGGPPAWGLAGITIAAEFIPNYSDHLITDKWHEVQDAIDKHDGCKFLWARREAQSITDARAIKLFLTAPSQLSHFAFHKVEEKFPNLMPIMSAYCTFVGENFKNENRLITNNIRKLFDKILIYRVKTEAELKLEEEADSSLKRPDMQVQFHLDEQGQNSEEIPQQLEN